MHIQLDPVKAHNHEAIKKQLTNLSLLLLCHYTDLPDDYVGSERSFPLSAPLGNVHKQIIVCVLLSMDSLSVFSPVRPLTDRWSNLDDCSTLYTVSSHSAHEGSSFSLGHLSELNFIRTQHKDSNSDLCCYCSCWKLYCVFRLVLACFPRSKQIS